MFVQQQQQQQQQKQRQQQQQQQLAAITGTVNSFYFSTPKLAQKFLLKTNLGEKIDFEVK